ncbi:MAG: restriction endonuclease subunit S [Scytonematopsis contorta HA4267-MV1]|jgi:type I restriction enzyme S subunit|nr:restriction endonuclease subunit S [Scytonematopsis contorta HA4267-MV1]
MEERDYGLEKLQDNTEKKGYKKTEVGVIPDDWNVKKLTCLCEAIIDCAHSTPAWTSNGIIVLRNQNIRNGQLDLSIPSYTDEAHFIERTRRAIPTNGDLVITREAPMGEVCMIPSGLPCCLGQRMVLLRPNLEKCYSHYLLYGLQSEPIRQVIKVNGGTGSTVSNLRIPLIEGLPIPLPPLPEQKAIAQSLTDVDALIAALDKLITKKRNIKQGAMQQLLTGKKRLPGFSRESFLTYKKTELGAIPIDWEVYYLRDIAKKITDGEHLTPKRSADGYYLLSARNIKNGLIDLSDVDFVDLEEYQRIRKRCNPEAGDVLISCSGTIGRVTVLPSGIECVMVRSAALIKLDKAKVNSYLIQYILQSTVGQLQITQSLNQGAQANLFITHIEKLKTPLPPLPEQKAIAQTLSDMDAEITALEKKRDKYKAIKQGMMQELLTGKTRLTTESQVTDDTTKQEV